MADDDDDKPAEAETQPDAGLGERVSSLEAGQTSMSEKINEILGIVKGGDSGRPAAPEAGPRQETNVAHEIREGLDRIQQTIKGQQAAPEPAKQEPEKPPEPMPRRVEKFMGWR